MREKNFVWIGSMSFSFIFYLFLCNFTTSDKSRLLSKKEKKKDNLMNYSIGYVREKRKVWACKREIYRDNPIDVKEKFFFLYLKHLPWGLSTKNLILLKLWKLFLGLLRLVSSVSNLLCPKRTFTSRFFLFSLSLSLFLLQKMRK